MLQHGEIGFGGIAAGTRAMDDALAQGGDGNREIEDVEFDAARARGFAQQVALPARGEGGIDDDRPAGIEQLAGELGQVTVGLPGGIGGVEMRSDLRAAARQGVESGQPFAFDVGAQADRAGSLHQGAGDGGLAGARQAMGDVEAQGTGVRQRGC